MRLPTPARVSRRIKSMSPSLFGRRREATGNPESVEATAYWAGLRNYHKSNDDSAPALQRSEWVSDVVGTLAIGSLLEVGTNSGRNLQVIRSRHSSVRLAGIDVNERAIAFARSKGLDIDFRTADANHWTEGDDSWEALLTMSVLDHIPDDAIETLMANMARTASRYVITVELWDGSKGTRGEFKYSRNMRDLFERSGLHTLHWEPSVGQYATANSPLWSYVGSRDVEPPLSDR
jgi:trans-aconitate methyltransferase